MAEGGSKPEVNNLTVLSQNFNEQLKIKSEDDSRPKEEHKEHKFILKYDDNNKNYEIHCDHPQTVLQAIRSKEKIKCEDENITLQIGEASMGTAIATHFPCICLKDGELVTLRPNNKQVEVTEKDKFDYTVSSRERYYCLYIETKGGSKTKTKKLYRSGAIKTFSRVCVYGTKEMTVREAIERDGRFIDLGDFTLEDVTKDNLYVYADDKVDKHEGKTFRICLEKTKDDGPTPKKAMVAQNQVRKTAHLKDLAEPRAVCVSDILKKAKTTQAEESSTEVEEIYKILRDQFPDLKQKMLSRFPGNTFQETLEKVDFGKAQQSFSDVFRLEKLLKLGKSVCKLRVGNTTEGSAFVLFKHFILTNAHLFKTFAIHNNSCDVKIQALFNYENPNLDNIYSFPVKNTMIDIDTELDYVILELELNEQNEKEVPPGLMRRFTKMPESGEACLIGHPGGGVKKIDPTCIIEKERRTQEVDRHLEQFKDNRMALKSVRQQLRDQGIERILSPSSDLADLKASYHTFMYHGSSGSPVFDAECRVFGLHTAGFVYGFPVKETESVIEIAHPVLLIFDKFVTNLKNKNAEDILAVIREESEGNTHLEMILERRLG